MKTTTPSAQGIYMGHDTNTDHWGIEVCADAIQYIDCSSPGVDMRARLQYTISTARYDWLLGGSFTSRMWLETAGLTVNGTITPSSDKRLKFNDKPIVNALDIINKLEVLHKFYHLNNIIKSK